MATYAVIGGTAAGEYHARQLRRALADGTLEGRVLVIESGWADFLRDWLPTATPADHVVPAPVMPHLLWDWLADAAGARRAEPPAGWRLPFEAAGAGGVRFVSAAGWMCPATCVEPGHCPAIHAPRDWDLAEMIERRALELGWEPAVFRCLHLTHGVGTVPAGALRAALERVLRLPPGARVLVATSSRCHAALGGLAIQRTG
jgi:hypothetical protein